MVLGKRTLEDYGFTMSKRQKRDDNTRDWNSSETISRLSARSSALGRPTDDFHIKIRLRSQAKAKLNDPKPAVPSASEDESQIPAEADITNVPERQSDDVHDGYSITSDESRFQPQSDDDPSHPLHVGYLRAEIAEQDEFAHLSWLEPMEVVVTRSPASTDEIVQLGFCGAKLIRRKKIEAVFYDCTRKPFDELTLMAFDLFDQYGKFKEKYKEHPFQKGSGFWQYQFDDGDILLLEDVIVDEHYRRCGLGKLMVNTLLEAARRKVENGRLIAIVWPEPTKDNHFESVFTSIVGDLRDIQRPSVFDQCDRISLPWIRSLGFRRIGTSIWFGLVYAKDRPWWRTIPPGQDYDPTRQDYPRLLPNAIRGAKEDKTFLNAVQHFYKHASESSWAATDSEGNTCLHLAALHFFERTVHWILKQPFATRLNWKRNSSGNTPLEAVLQRLEARRTRTLNGVDILMTWSSFVGHPEAAGKCVRSLQSSDKSETSLEQYLYGCTCGDCVGSYLSPRMNHILYMAASFKRDYSQDEWKSSGFEWVFEFCYLPEYFAKYARQSEAVRQGLFKVCDYVAECLLADKLPTPDAIHSSMVAAQNPQEVEKFLKFGGNFSGVISAVVQDGFSGDETFGYGGNAEILNDEDEPGGGWWPECRNDREYLLVARKLGLCCLATTLSNRMGKGLK